MAADARNPSKKTFQASGFGIGAGNYVHAR
jgi:hypothetical protein